jgi:hypothetical protein
VVVSEMAWAYFREAFQSTLMSHSCGNEDDANGHVHETAGMANHFMDENSDFSKKFSQNHVAILRSRIAVSNSSKKL